jgi:hypothetical protein
VFTVRVQTASRRALIIAAGGVAASALTGCQLGDPPPQWHPAPDRLLPLLAATIALVDRYDATIKAIPSLADRLTPLRDDHKAHVVALAREIGLDEQAPLAGVTIPPAPTPSFSGLPSTGPSSPLPATPSSSAFTPPSSPGEALGVLAGDEKSAQTAAEAACLVAPSYRAALLGSIAACRASHREVLQ